MHTVNILMFNCIVLKLHFNVIFIISNTLTINLQIVDVVVKIKSMIYFVDTNMSLWDVLFSYSC